jgi:hypothetical protein
MPHHKGSSLNASIFMCDHMVNLKTQANNHDTSEPIPIVHDLTSSSHPGGPLQIEKPYFDTLLHPPERNCSKNDTQSKHMGCPQLQYCGIISPGTLCHVFP